MTANHPAPPPCVPGLGRQCVPVRAQTLPVSDGRYWARTSDLQLVELALSQLS